MALPTPSFVWGSGGRALTEEEIAREREIAAQLQASGVDTSPIGHWTQGAARLAQALVGNIREARADAASADNASYNSDLIKALMGGGGASEASSGSTTASAMPMPGAAGEMAVTAPRKAGAGSTFSPFIETVKTGVELADGTKLAVTNPYALAAVAATGDAESGWSARNANRTWSDPSESGQAGTAGGILSWRGPRYQALAKTGDLSPEGQAKFFLRENPQLIAALNNAGSVEEAQRLMNNAWKFAGYNRPGGEAARRLSLARGYLSQFQGGTEVASLDPSSAVATAYVDPVVSAPNYQPETAPAAIEAVSPTGSAPPLDPPVDVASLPVAGVPMGDTQPAQVKAAPPVRVAGGGGRMADFGELNPALLQALTDPRATPQTQRVAGLLYEQQQAQAAAAQKAALAEQQAAEALAQRQAVASQLGIDPSYATDDEVWKAATGAQFREQPNDILEYEYARNQGYPGTFAQYQQEQRRAGATSVTTNVGEGDKFYENLDKKNAETFAALSDGGMQARTRMGQINRLESVLSQSPQGAEAAVKQWLGDIGVKTDGLDAIQATRALLEKMVPEQRPPGSGPMSDADIVMFRNSLPRLINQPGGNQIILNTMRAIAQYEMQLGEIADLVADRAIDPKEGRKRMRELANPLDGMRDLLKNAPAAPAKTNEIPSEIPGVIIRRKN